MPASDLTADEQTRIQPMQHSDCDKNESELGQPTLAPSAVHRVEVATLLVTAGLVLLLGGACNKSSAPDAIASGGTGKQAQSVSTHPVPTDPPPSAAHPTTAGPRFIAYYFHRTLRCATCLAIEKQSKETVEGDFRGALNDGRLAWQAVNIESPGKGHFEQDFQLQAQALILVEMKDGKVARWKNLPKVWELVENPPEFQEYVRSELSVFIGN
jgi:hypothetical protein